jgi:hypothetical protein
MVRDLIAAVVGAQLVHAALAQLEHEVVGLGADDLVSSGDHGLPVVNVVLVGGQEVRARARLF